MLFSFPIAASTSRLTDKYRPASIDSFIGLDKAKAVCRKIATSPFECSLLFVGGPGLGKTTMALALADAIPAELHHVPSQDCTVDRLREVVAACQYLPAPGKEWHLVLIDEADLMSAAAQSYLLSKLDSTAPPPRTIFVFTCNSTERFEPRFISRCMSVDFSSYGIASEVAAFLGRVWEAEAPNASAPNFARIVQNQKGNVRASLMDLQTQLLCA